MIAAQQVAVAIEGFELRELFLDGFGGVEEEADVGFAEHGGVVEGITGGDDVVVEILQGGDRFLLLIRLAEAVVDDAAVDDFQLVAEEGGPIELLHEWLGKFLEGVGENDHLGQGAKFG